MTAYVIGNITVKDPDKWAEYRSLVPLRTQAPILNSKPPEKRHGKQFNKPEHDRPDDAGQS